jgi:hypothetical protein
LGFGYWSVREGFHPIKKDETKALIVSSGREAREAKENCGLRI